MARKKAQTKPVPSTPVPSSPEAQEVPMETATNLKRRRSSGEGCGKKVCSGPPYPEDPLEGPSNAFPQKPLPQQAPLQLPFPPPFLSFPPPPPLPPLRPPPPPQYRTPQHAPPEQQSPKPLQLPQSLQPPQPPQLPQQIEQPQPQPHPEPPLHFPQLPKTRLHQILHVARSHSLEKQSLQSLPRTLSLPSLCPSSSPELFPEMITAEPEPAAAVADSSLKLSRRQAKAANRANRNLTDERRRKAVALCTIGPESVADYELRKSLKPLLVMGKN